MHLLKNPLLACAVEQHLHPELVRHLPALWDIAERAEANAWNALPLNSVGETDALRWLRQCKTKAPGVYAVPFLNPLLCTSIVSEFAGPGGPAYATNADEELPYRIPELVLSSECPQMFRTARELLLSGLSPVLTLLQARVPAVIRTVQLARYTAGGTEHGNWHHDEDSDQTIVVSLAPDLFKGGGTDIKLCPFEQSHHHIPALPQGHALIFNGKMTLHRGCLVTEGERHLLVYWTEAKA